ncbi:MAG: cytochrome c family protein [Salinivirgaceae bacterium]|nr:cytochrome c family protein [Salinivirgaceae bacterium]
MRKLFVFILSVLFVSTLSLAQDFEYIGAAKCKMCHNKPATGAQYNKWSEASHAKAFETLKGEKAMAYAKEKGIADPSKEAKCLKCHSTFHAIDADLNISLKEEEGVSCETCHGPGSRYKSMSIMKDHDKSVANGLIVPDEALCKTCHKPEGNDFYKPFVYEEALKKIAHPNPAAN